MTTVSSTVPTHGNYHNYHGYLNHHPGPCDPRLSLLPRELLLGARVLDIGCNEGWVSCEIAQTWGARRVVGVDIDDALVRMAWKRRRMLWSHQQPVDSEPPRDDEDDRPKKKRKRGGKDTHAEPLPKVVKADYFPASCQHMFGPLPVPPAEVIGGVEEFPHNISFRRADWTNETIPEDAGSYDVVVAFSVSKWIHLNGGDEGLKRFFRRIYDVLSPGGTFVFEPQQWDSYTKARKLDSVLQENAKNLKLRPESFDELLQEIGFEGPRRLGEVGEGRFRRPVELYTKSN
ncbi:Bin3-domain-containing protein [Dentipellis sp. KUC8613]|nr:Bin3-domain-containing protein [Dentipellis sp. KUC8613]